MSIFILYRICIVQEEIYMNRSTIIAAGYGWMAVLIHVLIFALFTSLILQFITITELTLTYVTFSIDIIALFIGGFIAGLKGKGKGWLLGAITGIGFTLFTFMVQYLGFNGSFTFQQIIYHSSFILAAIAGSVIGVNLVTVKNEE